MSDKMNYERLVEILNKDMHSDNPRILSIERPPEYQVEISKELWNSMEKDKQVDRLQFLEDYVNLLFIRDNFPTNAERKEWKVAMERTYDGFRETYDEFNAMKFGKVNVVHDYIRDLFDGYTGINKADKKRFRHLRDRVLIEITKYNKKSISRQDYRNLDPNNRELYIKEVHKQVVKILGFLSEISSKLES